VAPAKIPAELDTSSRNPAGEENYSPYSARGHWAARGAISAPLRSSEDQPVGVQCQSFTP